MRNSLLLTVLPFELLCILFLSSILEFASQISISKMTIFLLKCLLIYSSELFIVMEYKNIDKIYTYMYWIVLLK